MRKKILLVLLVASVSLAAPAFAGHRHFCHSGGVSWSIGLGFPFFFGGYGYPYYGGYYGGYYPYYGSSYPYYTGYGSYYPYYSSYGYRGTYYPRSGYYTSRAVDRYRGGSLIARVQERLSNAGYYRGSIDGIIGPRTRSAIRAYERSHGLPVDGELDRQLLATMGLA